MKVGRSNPISSELSALSSKLANGGDLVSTGVVGAMCMSDWAIPLRGPFIINANNTDYRPAYAAA